MDLKHIKQQIEQSKMMVSELKKQNVIFGNIIQQAVKGVPNEYKADLLQLQTLLYQSEVLAKQGKMEEVHTLLNNFKDGRKNSK